MGPVGDSWHVAARGAAHATRAFGAVCVGAALDCGGMAAGADKFYPAGLVKSFGYFKVGNAGSKDGF